MSQLLNIDELRELKDLGSKVDVAKINPIISQAQDSDLRDFLGARFYFDILNNLDNPNYESLINGGNFTVAGQVPQVEYRHEGLKSMLADLFMAKFIVQINTNITPFGATIKHSDNSEPADRNTLRDLATMNSQMAGSKWEIIKMYLDENSEQFPAYNACSDTIASGERRLKFRKI